MRLLSSERVMNCAMLVAGSAVKAAVPAASRTKASPRMNATRDTAHTASGLASSAWTMRLA